MGGAAVTGSDVIMIDGRVLNDLADADCWAIEFPNDVGVAKASRNGNTIFAKDEKGRLAEVTIRVIRGSSDHKYLNSRMAQWMQDPASFVLHSGYFSKRVGDGQGKFVSDTYACAGGVPKRQPNTKSNADGDAEQSVAVYTITFANATPVIQ